MEVSGQLHASAALHPGKSLRYPLDRRLGVPRICLEAVEKIKILPCRCRTLCLIKYFVLSPWCAQWWRHASCTAGFTARCITGPVPELEIHFDTAHTHRQDRTDECFKGEPAGSSQTVASNWVSQKDCSLHIHTHRKIYSAHVLKVQDLGSQNRRLKGT
jgi:hypothetical protein